MSKKGSDSSPKTYEYFLSWAIGICMGPVDTLLAVYKDDDLVWVGELDCPATGGKETVAIDGMGTMNFYFGTDDHSPISDMNNLCYRGLCFAHFKNCSIGATNKPPVMSFVFRKSPSCSFDPTDAYKDIGDDYNPVHAIWLVLREYSNFPAEWLNEAAFLAAAEKIHTESRGIQSIISERQTVLSYIEQVATHINAMLSYRSDGKLHFNLLRTDDYDASTLPVIDENTLLEPPTIKRKGWVDTKNEIRVRYSRRYYRPKSVQLVYICWIDESVSNYYPNATTAWINDLASARAQKVTIENSGIIFSAITCHVLHDAYSEANGIYPESVDFPHDLANYIRITASTTSKNVSYLFERILDPRIEEIYVVSTVDNSGSMTTETIEPLYTQFKTALIQNYANVEIVEHEESRTDERWLLWMTSDSSDALDALLTGYDYTKAIASPMSIDIANKDIQGMTVSQSLDMPLFTKNQNAVWAGDEALRQLSHPSATIVFPASRDAFRLEPVDLFRLSYAGYGIENIICRVVSIEEQNLTDEIINITALEEAAGSIIPDDEYSEPTSHNTAITPEVVNRLPYSRVIEVPYSTSDVIAVKPICARYTGSERGYLLYMSIDDGESFSQVLNVGSFDVYGTLTTEYPADTYTIDDDVGFYVEFTNNDFNSISSIGRADLFEGTNLALLGDEFISFQTITPISDTVCHITGVFRGRLDTLKEAHPIDEEFFFIGENPTALSHSSLVVGEERLFRFVPYSITKFGDLATSTERSLTIEGRAKKPYLPWNFLANDGSFDADYTDDVVLTWDARVRDFDWVGMETVVESTHEGLFEIEVYVSDILVRTQTAINAVTWTYTEAMNLSDNTTLADEIEFKLLNYIESGGLRYESDQTTVSVEKE